jgi:hypothetical protein
LVTIALSRGNKWEYGTNPFHPDVRRELARDQRFGRAGSGGDDHQHVLVGERLDRGHEQALGVLADGALGHEHDRLPALGLVPPRWQGGLLAGAS